MATEETPPLHLLRIDPACNMARFYLVSLQPTLFGGLSVMRNWGRIGKSGQVKIETFDSTDEAGIAFKRLERAKRRKGYDDSAKAKR